MKYETINNILEKNNFFGYTVKRNGSRLTYSFLSISYFTVKIEVEVIKVNPETFGMSKMVSKILFNGKEVKDFKEFIDTLKNVYKIHKQERAKLFVKV